MDFDPFEVQNGKLVNYSRGPVNPQVALDHLVWKQRRTARISTVYLPWGISSDAWTGKPRPYETMVFSDDEDLDLACTRWTSYGAAVRGHKMMIKFALTWLCGIQRHTITRRVITQPCFTSWPRDVSPSAQPFSLPDEDTSSHQP